MSTTNASAMQAAHVKVWLRTPEGETFNVAKALHFAIAALKAQFEAELDQAQLPGDTYDGDGRTSACLVSVEELVET